MLLRADVGRLPFATGSVAALHAGAAIHCWPNPTAAVCLDSAVMLPLCSFTREGGLTLSQASRTLQVAEISRVLQPGGVFVASTFLKASAPLGQLLNNDDIVRPLNAVRSFPVMLLEPRVLPLQLMMGDSARLF
jgi:hypothetical protein